MHLLLFKLTVTPLLIIGATLLQRRFGGAIGGMIVGLPVTSAPLSIFLALQHGSAFAAAAAVGTVLGLIGTAVFCLAYARAARGLRWPLALAFACLASGLAFALLQRLPQRPDVAAALAFPALLGIAVGMGRAGAVPALPHVWWDLPTRAAFALAAVLGITAAAPFLGPTWSGMLATLPILSAVMGGFTHRHAGAEAARALLRGVVVGSLGAAAFNLVVALALAPWGMGPSYGGGLLVALGVATLAQVLLPRRSGATDREQGALLAAAQTPR
jgi:hypothetical protein